MRSALCAGVLAATLFVPLHVHAHGRSGPSDASAVSMLPLASVVVGGAAVSVGVVALPVALTVSGAVLVVKTVEVSARGTLCVLERASDGARVTLELTARGSERAVLSVGQAVDVSVTASGTMLSVAGKAIAFIPTALGEALLHNERLTW
ncbi:MAG: hypothetical protein JNL19_13200 [Burkholderiales bacterium]|nr:hypothetical protein [Burkholderiales bacterium]